MALVGNLKDIKLANLVQLNCMEHNTAKLTIEHNGKYGFIYFEKGQVVHAEYDPFIGEQAFFRLLQLIAGNFKVESGIRAPAKTISTNWNNLLLEGLHRLDNEDRVSGENYMRLFERLYTIKGVNRIYTINSEGQVLAKSTEDIIPNLQFVLALASYEADKIGNLIHLKSPQFISMNLSNANIILVKQKEKTLVLEVEKKTRLDLILPLIKKALSTQ